MKQEVLGDAQWHWQGASDFTIGMEEEVMLLDDKSFELAPDVERVLNVLPDHLRPCFAPETYPTAIEIVGAPAGAVRDSAEQLKTLRSSLKLALSGLGLAGAAAGTHPYTHRLMEPVHSSPRARDLRRSMRWLVCREPTFALHVHVGVADPKRAVALMNRMRCHVPLLLALSGNSPYLYGQDTGFCSIRTPIFDAFPRTGIPRMFDSYRDWVHTARTLVEGGVIADVSFIWWDVRLRPQLGTVEIRSMDSQASLSTTAALSAFVQAVARLELEEGYAPVQTVVAQEVLQENRFLAARDGLDALLLTSPAGERRSVGRLILEIMEAAWTHAQALGCDAYFGQVEEMLGRPGATQQRRWAAQAGVRAVSRELSRLL